VARLGGDGRRRVRELSAARAAAAAALAAALATTLAAAEENY